MKKKYDPNNLDLTNWSYVSMTSLTSSGLTRHGRTELVPVCRSDIDGTPGGLVRHVDDPGSFGTLIATHGSCCGPGRPYVGTSQTSTLTSSSRRSNRQAESSTYSGLSEKSRGTHSSIRNYWRLWRARSDE